MSNKNKYLINMNEGENGTIISICGGKMATKRLMDLGLVPGTRIKILSKALFKGPVEIGVRGSKLVIGRRLSAKILVGLI